MWERKKWLPIAIFIYVVQLLLELFAGIKIAQLGMLPGKFLAVVYLLLVAMAAVTFVLLFLGTGHGPSKKRRVRRVVSVVLALIMGIGSVFATSVAGKVLQTVDSVTEGNVLAVEGVYVLKSDSASKLKDAANYTFGISNDFDADNARSAVNTINDKLGKSITVTESSTATDNVDALYKGDVKAIIMNESYEKTLKKMDGYKDFNDKVKKIYEVKVTQKTTGGKDVTKDPFIVYISGSDTRSDILDTSRSDVNILMVVDPTTKQILLVNTPRDYYVENPAGNWAYDKLTHCGIYGVGCSEQALGNLYGCDINYYAQINFTGFETLIDDIGGITVESPQAFTADGYTFTSGANKLNGKQALAFARERHSFSGGDNVRGQNQMRVIEAVITQMTANGSKTLMNYGKILDSLSGTFMTDLSSQDIKALVKMQLNKNSSWNVVSYAVTGTGGMDTSYSMPNSQQYVMYQNKDSVAKASDLINKVEKGEKISDADAA